MQANRSLNPILFNRASKLTEINVLFLVYLQNVVPVLNVHTVYHSLVTRLSKKNNTRKIPVPRNRNMTDVSGLYSSSKVTDTINLKIYAHNMHVNF